MISDNLKLKCKKQQFTKTTSFGIESVLMNIKHWGSATNMIVIAFDRNESNWIMTRNNKYPDEYMKNKKEMQCKSRVERCILWWREKQSKPTWLDHNAKRDDPTSSSLSTKSFANDVWLDEWRLKRNGVIAQGGTNTIRTQIPQKKELRIGEIG